MPSPGYARVERIDGSARLPRDGFGGLLRILRLDEQRPDPQFRHQIARVGDVARARLFARLVGDHARHMQVIRVGEIGKRLVERDDLRACERRKLLSQFGVERRQPRDVAFGILLIDFRVLRVGFRQPAAIFCT